MKVLRYKNISLVAAYVNLIVVSSQIINPRYKHVNYYWIQNVKATTVNVLCSHVYENAIDRTHPTVNCTVKIRPCANCF